MRNSEDLRGQLALITGASRGLGRCVALLLAARGAEMILVSREEKSLSAIGGEVEAAGGRPVLTPLDLTDGAGIDRLGGAIAERWGKLDMFIGAAAVLDSLSPAAHIAPAMWEHIFAVNCHANQRFIRSTEALLAAAAKENGTARAVFLTCGESAAYWSAYAASKAALERLVLCWGQEIGKQGVRVNLFDPAPMATTLRGIAFPGAKEDFPPPQPAAKAMMSLLAPQCASHCQLIRYADEV